MARHPQPLAALSTLLLFLPVLTLAAPAARACTASSYRWSLLDFRYDGADPAKNGDAAVAQVSAVLSPNTTRSLHSCHAQWPEAWAGWYGGEAGKSIVWTDCLWTGPGANYEDTVSFALDYKAKMVYMSHTYTCSDAARRGVVMLATGSTPIDFTCSTSAGSGPVCFSKSERYTIDSKQDVAPLAAGADCADLGKRPQSWVLDKLVHSYDKVDDKGTTTEKAVSFVLKNVAVADKALACSSSAAQLAEGSKTGVVEGTCAAEGGATTTAKFKFNTRLSLVEVTQTWTCAEGALEASGAATLLDTCQPSGDSMNCGLEQPVWIGQKAV